jgi:ribosomal protein L40E
MECSYCGANNPEGSSFCSKCGREILSEIVCVQCGETLEQGSNFCHACGTKIKASKAGPAGVSKTTSASARQRSNAKRVTGKKGKKNTAQTFIPVVIVVVVIAGVLIWVLSLSPSSGNRSSESRDVNIAPVSNQAWAAEVQAIATNFNCPCGECGITPLDSCTCDAPRGAVEVKSYISELLDQGLSKFEVVKLVEEQYGNRR